MCANSLNLQIWTELVKGNQAWHGPKCIFLILYNIYNKVNFFLDL